MVPAQQRDRLLPALSNLSRRKIPHPRAGPAATPLLKRLVHPLEEFPGVFPTEAKLQGDAEVQQMGSGWIKLKAAAKPAPAFASTTRSDPLKLSWCLSNSFGLKPLQPLSSQPLCCPFSACRVELPLKLPICVVLCLETFCLSGCPHGRAARRRLLSCVHQGHPVSLNAPGASQDKEASTGLNSTPYKQLVLTCTAGSSSSPYDLRGSDKRQKWSF